MVDEGRKSGKYECNGRKKKILRRVSLPPRGRPDALPPSYQGRSMGLNSDIRGGGG